MADTSNASRDPHDLKIEALSEALTESRIRNEVLATAYGQISIMLVRSFDDAAGVRRTSAGTYQRIAELEGDLRVERDRNDILQDEIGRAVAAELNTDRMHDGLLQKIDAASAILSIPGPRHAERVIALMLSEIVQLRDAGRPEQARG